MLSYDFFLKLNHHLPITDSYPSFCPYTPCTSFLVVFWLQEELTIVMLRSIATWNCKLLKNLIYNVASLRICIF